jgi:predicted nucleic acid-binding protein
MRVYLDVCAIQRPADDRRQERIDLEAQAVLEVLFLVEKQELELICSTAVLIEHARNPHRERRELTEDVLSIAREIISITPAVESRAERYRQRGLKPMDAAHLACAVEAGADFFCTCDDRLLRNAGKVDTGSTRPVNPTQLIQEIRR